MINEFNQIETLEQLKVKRWAEDDFNKRKQKRDYDLFKDLEIEVLK